MRRSSTLNLGTGTFVVLGFAALFFPDDADHQPRSVLRQRPALRRVGEVRQHRRFAGGGAGVHGRAWKSVASRKSTWIPVEYKAVVLMRMNQKFNQIPTDSDASIYTQGLLGGKFIGLTAGGAETYLKDKDQIDFTQSAFVLENLIGQFLANFAKGQSKDDAAATPAATEKTK